MINKLTDKVMTAKPVNLGLLLILMPFVTGFLNAITALVLLLMGYELIIQFIAIALAIDVAVYFLWIWGVAVKMNQEQLPELQLDTRWFKICSWIFFSYCMLWFISSINIDAIRNGQYPPNVPVDVLDTLWNIYGLAVFVSYGYLALFTAKVIRTIEQKREANMADSFPYAFMIWAFPIGIPLIQAKLRTGFNIHEYMKSISPFK